MQFLKTRPFYVWGAAAAALAASAFLVLLATSDASGQGEQTATLSFEKDLHRNWWKTGKSPKECDHHLHSECGGDGVSGWEGHQDQYLLTWSCPAHHILNKDGAQPTVWYPSATNNPNGPPPPGQKPSASLPDASESEILALVPEEKRATCVPPTPVLTVSDASGNEGTNLSFQVELTEGPASAQVRLRTSNGTSNGAATAPDDYNALNNVTWTFARGTPRTVRVGARTDTVDEGDETFTLTASVTSPGGSATASGTGTILNVTTTTQPPPTTPTTTTTTTIPMPDPDPVLTVSDVSVTAGQTANFRVTLENASGVVTAYTEDGTAEAGTDYTSRSAMSAAMQFRDGQTRTVSVATRKSSGSGIYFT